MDRSGLAFLIALKLELNLVRFWWGLAVGWCAGCAFTTLLWTYGDKLLP